MAIKTVAERNALAAKYGQDAAYAALHSADPGTAGGSEIAGVARQAISWSAPVDGVITAQVVFNVASGTSVGGAGLWSALTAGTYRDGGTLAVQSFSADGTYTLNLSYTQT